MGDIGSLKARRLLAALLNMGFVVRGKPRGSHRFLVHQDGRTMLFAFHDRETIGPKMLGKILKDLRLTYDSFRKYF